MQKNKNLTNGRNSESDGTELLKLEDGNKNPTAQIGVELPKPVATKESPQVISGQLSKLSTNAKDNLTCGVLCCVVIGGCFLVIFLPILFLVILNKLCSGEDLKICNDGAGNLMTVSQYGQIIKKLALNQCFTVVFSANGSDVETFIIRYQANDCNVTASKNGGVSVDGIDCALYEQKGWCSTYDLRDATTHNDDYDDYDDDDLFSLNTVNETDLSKLTSKFSKITLRSVSSSEEKKTSKDNSSIWSNLQSLSLFNHKQPSNDETPADVLEYKSDASISPFV